MLNRTPYLLIAAFFFLMTGCTLEQKLARTFIEQERQGRFYLLQPSLVFKYNLKDFEIPGFDTLAEADRDSVLLQNSLFLKDVSDSVLTREFISGLTRALENYGAEVMPESAVDTMMQNGGTPYIINIAQLSLEEFIHPFSSEQPVYDEVLVIDGFDVNAINYNVWIEMGRMNTEKSNKVLFSSDYLTDEVNGSLKQNLATGKMTFDYTIDTITMPRIYEFSRKFGRIVAASLFDYLMNKYVEENLPEDYPYERYYYHYEPSRNLLYIVTDEERIIELDDDR